MVHRSYSPPSFFVPTKSPARSQRVGFHRLAQASHSVRSAQSRKSLSRVAISHQSSAIGRNHDIDQSLKEFMQVIYHG